MKRIAIIAAIVVALGVATFAFGQAEPRFTRNEDPRPTWFFSGLYVGPKSLNPVSSTKNKITRVLGASATIDFASTSVGTVDSSSITLTGAQVGDACSVGTPATNTADASFTCYVDASNSVKVRFHPTAFSTGTCTLNAASPAVCTVNVLASSRCNCSLVGTTAATAAKGCAVSLSGTTLTVTSANSANEVVNVNCSSAVDPVSATYYVRVVSSQ